MANIKFTDNALTTLASSISDTATQLTVASSTGANFPTAPGGEGYFVISMSDALGNREFIKCEYRSSDILGSVTYPLVRGYGGTSARSWSAGDAVDLTWNTAAMDAKDAENRALFGGAFGQKYSTTTGLTFGYYGATLDVGGTVTSISDGTVALTGATTNYIEATPAGSVSTNTSGFTAGRLPLYTVVTGASVITSVTDKRVLALGAVNKTIIDAKGDLIVGTAADTPARKAVSSTNGDTLLADSAASDGWSYGQPSRRKNAIINGDFNIWQRGTSFGSIANSAYSSDRWRYLKTVSAVHDVARSTDVPTVAQAGRLFNYSMLVDCTTADASIGSGDICAVEQVIEGYNWLPLAQRAITLSFWVKATKTGTYCVALRNNASGTPDRCITKEYTVNATDTWEFKTLTFAASPSAGTWDYTNGAGVGVGFVLAAGSTYQTTADAWQTGHYYATANQVNACDSTSNNFRICGVQLEAGSVATEFEHRTFQDELAMCQRYFWKTISGSGATGAFGLSTYGGTAGGTLRWTITLPVTMRTNPSVTKSGTWQCDNCNQPAIDGQSPDTIVIGSTSSAAGGCNIYLNSSDDTIQADAEL